MDNTIQKAHLKDVDTIKQIEVECGLSRWSENDYRAETEHADNLFFIFRKNSDVTGFIIARLIMKYSQTSSENEIEIYNIGVKKGFRHQKIGSKLLKKIFEEAEEKKVGRIYLEVRKSNAGALEFYLKNGFKIVGERKNFYANPTEDAVLMCRSTAD
jgi:[ribosomal protein S18]-alanine N-acetyltransferase